MQITIFFQGLITIHNKVRFLDDAAASKCDVTRRVWVAMHDEDENVKELAVDLWNKLRYKITSSICTELLVGHISTRSARKREMKLSDFSFCSLSCFFRSKRIRFKASLIGFSKANFRDLKGFEHAARKFVSDSENSNARAYDCLLVTERRRASRTCHSASCGFGTSRGPVRPPRGVVPLSSVFARFLFQKKRGETSPSFRLQVSTVLICDRRNPVPAWTDCVLVTNIFLT